MTPRCSGPAVLRLGLGASGLALLGVGGWHLARLPDPYPVLVWLGGAVLLHDALIGPLVMAAGLLAAALPGRAVVRGALVTGGALLVIALPALLRPGRPANPSVLPLPYGRNLLILLALTAAAALAGVLRARRTARTRREEGGVGARRR